MKNALPLGVFISAFAINLVMNEFPALPGSAAYVVEAAIALAAVGVVAQLMVSRKYDSIPLRYVIVFLLFGYSAFSAALINGVATDVTFAGIRSYFKYVPLFLLPLAFDYSDRDIRFQIGILFLLMLIQIPLTVYQRLIEYQAVFTGDFIVGSLGTTAALCAVCSFGIVYVAARYLDRQVSLGTSLVLSVLLLLPAALGETKVTPIFLAVGAAGLWLVRRNILEMRQTLAVSGVGMLLLILFVGIYDVFYSREDGTGYLGLITNKERMIDNYNLKGVRGEPFKPYREAPGVVGKEAKQYASEPVDVGRLDSLRMPFDALFPHEPLRLVFGLGVGNIDSSFGDGGRYRYIKYELGGSRTGLGVLIWETGLVGAIAFIAFMGLLARDAFVVARRRVGTFTGAFAAAFFGITLIMLLNLIYANMFHQQILPILFIYFAGVVVCRRLADQRSAYSRPSRVGAVAARA